MAAALTAPLFADDATPPLKPWSDKAEVSLVSTNGNSKGTTTSIKNLLAYAWNEITRLEVAGGGLGSQNNHQVTAENYNASEKYTLKLVGKNYAFERFGWDKDRFAGIQNRYDSSAGLGRLLLDLPNDKLHTELGGGYVGQEFTDGLHDNYASGRAYAKYEHALSASSSFTQDAEYIHNFKDSKGYRLNTETALTAALSTHLSLKASFVWKRNGLPPPGVVKDDTITSMALVVNY